MKLQQPSISARVMPVKMGKEKSMAGGKWEVVKEFKGRSHKDGGIDIEVGGGYVRNINAQNEKPDVIAKNGRFWKNLGAGAYGVGEGLLDTVTMGATDQFTDMGYTALQKAGGSTEDEMREQNSIRGYGTAAGAITGGILSGGAATGSAIQQGAKGVGAGIGEGSRGNKTADAIGTYLPMAGSIAGMAVGNAGFKSGTKEAQELAGSAKKAADLATKTGDTAGAATKTAEAAKYAAKADRMAKMGNLASNAGKLNKYAPLAQGATSALSATGPQQAMDLGPVQQGIRGITPFLSPSMMKSYGELGREMRGAGGPSNQSNLTNLDGGSSSPLISGGAGEGPIMFRQQPLTQDSAFNYLSRYGINT
jgi:hypothetical protein